MRVLMIAYFRESSGWGQAARDWVLALDSVGVDVVVRCVNLSNSNFELPPRIAELENKDSSGCDICIQNLLPHHMEYHGGFKKNIGMFFCETSNFSESSWADQLNLMDELIVACESNKSSAKESGVTVPIHVVPLATDVTRFERSYGTFERLKPYKDQGKFLFYVIGEWIRRKNMGALLRAFHTEFDPDENVELVIKSSVPGLSPADSAIKIEAACDEMKRALKLHGGHLPAYKKELLITDRLSQEGIMKLHSTCDCFVGPSHAEAWSIPAFDAMALGKTPIVPCVDPFTSFVSNGGYLVRRYDSQVFGVDDSFGDLFTGREIWSDVSQEDLQDSMRMAFGQTQDRKERAACGRNDAYTFTYEIIGLLLQKVLEHGEETS